MPDYGLKWVSRLILIGFLIAVVSFIAMVAVPDTSAVYEIFLGVLVSLACVGLPVSAVNSVFALRHLQETRRKRKNDALFGEAIQYESGHVDMEAIMSRLSEEEQVYLQERLARHERGLSDDGELTSLDELLKR